MSAIPLPKWSGENVEHAMTSTVGFAKQVPLGWGKAQTRIHRAPQIFKGPLGPSASTKRRKSPEYDMQQRLSAESEEYPCGYLEALHSFMNHQTTPRSFGLGTKDNNNNKVYLCIFFPTSFWRLRKLFTTKIPPYAQVWADRDRLQLRSTKGEVNPQEALPVGGLGKSPTTFAYKEGETAGGVGVGGGKRRMKISQPLRCIRKEQGGKVEGKKGG